MLITLEDVLNLRIFESAKIKAANLEISYKPVEGVSVLETQLENYIQKNDLILCTAVSFYNNINEFEAFLQDLATCEAAGLAIATGKYIDEIPQKILHLADEKKLPIIDIPYKIRFADITQAVLHKINEGKINIVKKSEELQKEILQLFLSNATLSEAAETIHKLAGMPVLIVDQAGMIKGYSDQSEKLMNKRKDAIDSLSALNSLKHPEQTLSNSTIEIEMQTNNKTIGYIIMDPDINGEELILIDEARQILHYITTTVALWFQKEKAIMETELRMRDDFVWSLAKGEIHSWDTVLSRAKALNYSADLTYVCIIGYAENLSDIFINKNAEPSGYDQWIERTEASIEEQIKLTGDSFQQRLMTTYQRDDLLIFLEISENQMQDTVTRFLDRAENRLKKIIPDLIMSWGIGENYAGKKLFNESYNDARTALEIGRRQLGPGFRNTYTNTGIYRILTEMAKKTEIVDVVMNTIGGLIEYDNRTNSNLVKTLTVYIKNQSNASKAARDLYLHRHTLLYRLRKIESITSRSLLDPNDLFMLDLSIRLWMTGINPENNYNEA